MCCLCTGVAEGATAMGEVANVEVPVRADSVRSLTAAVPCRKDDGLFVEGTAEDVSRFIDGRILIPAAANERAAISMCSTRSRRVACFSIPGPRMASGMWAPIEV